MFTKAPFQGLSYFNIKGGALATEDSSDNLLALKTTQTLLTIKA